MCFSEFLIKYIADLVIPGCKLQVKVSSCNLKIQNENLENEAPLQKLFKHIVFIESPRQTASQWNTISYNLEKKFGLNF